MISNKNNINNMNLHNDFDQYYDEFFNKSEMINGYIQNLGNGMDYAIEHNDLDMINYFAFKYLIDVIDGAENSFKIKYLIKLFYKVIKLNKFNIIKLFLDIGLNPNFNHINVRISFFQKNKILYFQYRILTYVILPLI